MLAQLIRGYIALCEAYSAGNYSAAVWRRWWGNSETGQLLPIDLREDHDSYFFNNLDEFFSPHELQYLPDPNDDSGYENVGEDDNIQNNRDAILVAAYDKGWHAIIYDGNNRHLSLRTGSHPNLRGLRKIIRKIVSEWPVSMFIMDIGTLEYRLDVDEIERFIKFGRLPAR